ncbi:hypothetical protein CBR_g4177 [Chara braunii]|uniref:Right handed beta helix domain-containing protein n=1 Tax=Chara braunii TaxID=69332 RepID=A0A388KHN1_CHABU|nr:hypothetical protein CBR_g4177 [Chara braunii]|eukprot:GBG69483.1 hypothetical protein CBR_g4177 [Chara braunii]
MATLAGERVGRGGQQGGAARCSATVVAPLATIAVLVLLALVPAAYGYGVKEFMRDYKNPSVSRIQVSGNVILTSNLPRLERNLTIVGAGRKRPVIDGQNKYSGIATSDVLVVRNVEFRNFVTREGSGGGAIKSFGDNNKLERCVFRNNKALSNGSDSDAGDGGAISFYGNTWTITNCEFIGNRADGVGGALWTLGESSGRVTGSVFKNNYSKSRGGAIGFRGSFARVDKCTFEGNKEDGEGGGALSCSRSACYISNTAFRNNVAKGDGGAIRFFGDEEGGFGVLCKGNTFSGNKATNSSSSNIYIRVDEGGGLSWSFCAKAPPNTFIDGPSGSTKNGDCKGCPK